MLIVRGMLMFTKPGDVIPDEERPGLRRARPVLENAEGDVHVCDLIDLASPDVREPGLEEAGFETVDLSGNAALQAALREVLEQDHIDEGDAEAIRASLEGARFRLANGTMLRIDHVADDGLFHRRSGPHWVDVNPGGIVGANGHGGAAFVHGDQDVYGTPLRQMMHGAAPDLFRHVTPDGRNDEATTFLLNLWIPLHAPVQPLALMDRRTLDARRHQLRYGLPVEDFLERDEDAVVNDIWSFLHDDDQQWYIRTGMGPDQGYLFDTLGTGHGAAVLPGEAQLAEQFRLLQRTCEAIDAGHPGALAELADARPDAALPDDATADIRSAWQRMAELIRRGPGAVSPEAWRDDARGAMDAVIRRSVELRLVATVVED